jgi:hypothetical protein
MNRSARQLALRQQLLLLRSAELRLEFVEHTAAWQTPLSLADRVHQGWRWLRGHPEAVAAAVLGLAVLRPRRAWRWGARLWWGWQLWQRVQRFQARHLGQAPGQAGKRPPRSAG